MDDQVNPEVGLAEYEELDADGTVTEIEAPEDEALTADEPAQPPTSRRSRAVDKGQRTPAPEKPINLDELPQFQAWKSNMDRQLAEERRQREQMQAMIEQREQEAATAQYQALERAMSEADDPDQQRQYAQQLGQLQAAQQYAAWQKWDTHVRSRATEEGFSATDFDPRNYSGATGAAQFERDLAAKKAAKLQAEVESYKKASDPANIQKMIDEAVAKKLQAAGLNAVDTAQPATPVNAGSSWARDLALFQQGRMSREEFKKRWGNK